MTELTHPEKIREERHKVAMAVRQQTVGYILAALGLVAGLAWNDAIKSAIAAVFPASGNGIIAQFVYAFLVTLMVAILAYFITKFFMKDADAGKK